MSEYIGCRRSELVAVADINGLDTDGAGVLAIGRSKTDLEGHGALAYLSPATMDAIETWPTCASIVHGPLFRRVWTYFDGAVRGVSDGAMHAGTIALIYSGLSARFSRDTSGHDERCRARALGCAVSIHSIRVGIAQDHFAAGESLPAIMQVYRWRDPKPVMRYGA